MWKWELTSVLSILGARPRSGHCLQGVLHFALETARGPVPDPHLAAGRVAAGKVVLIPDLV
ncbi:hypothetical protein CNECB9_3430054 [Cupriavidus necator]|uniref:Uncharacterized protein n=1 Tax=Cupriavidus necator TaxID=106590 RepID=A0A1K0JCD6_CUPNE|nr:hypothetical protein CNECB9_3430054 [Cupriavidus necator]